MTDPIRQDDIIAALNNSTLDSQLQLNRIRELEDEVRRLKPYEHFCEVQTRYIASIGRHDDLHKFIKKEQAQVKAEKKRHKFYVVGD